MASFINTVVKHLDSQNVNFSDLTFVLPSKRAGVFLKQEITSFIKAPIFSPNILSTEEFVNDLAQLRLLSNTELLFEFYDVYLQLTPTKLQEGFESFSKWAQLILQDFNEIDRYLIPQKKIFNYLNAIQELQHWSLETTKTELVENYLSFWKKLPQYYALLTERLLAQKKGYQGLIYRKAVTNLNHYIASRTHKKIIFMGFNALNTAEETIIKKLLKNNIADIFWDIDEAFVKAPIHHAGFFIKSHKTTWEHYKTNSFKWLTNNYTKKKAITIYGVPKNIGQAKTIGSILETLDHKTIQNTAIVLGDENLLTPTLNSIPNNVGAVNITMGIPLKSIPLATLFENIFALQKENKNTIYYKSVIAIITHEFIRPLLKTKTTDYAHKLITYIKKNTITYLSVKKLTDTLPEHKELINLLFSSWNSDSTIAIQNCQILIKIIKTFFDEKKNKHLITLEYLFRFNTIFNELLRLTTTYPHVKNIATLHAIYKELLSLETLDFKGEPLQGLQIMGMLESRVLDFETVIITSVNEGILPSGKTNNSFIPFDVKIENKLPTYKEKDAVYTYHFYRLLQRAKTVYILYNTEIDVLTGGEKSRFINQLEAEGIHDITHKILTPSVPKLEKTYKQVEKTSEIITTLKQVAEKGFSPSSLTNYIRNPIDFYNEKLLGIKEIDTLEENIATNTFGTIIHNTLEILYTPLINKTLTVDAIEALKVKVTPIVLNEFEENYNKENISNGYNLIAFEVAKRYVNNFLNYEISTLKRGAIVKLIALEEKHCVQIPIPELNCKVNLTGTVDRIDNYNGTTRIIDYKTGNVKQNQVDIINWEDLTTDYDKYSKSFQVLTYAYMLNLKTSFNTPIEAGIISFKNLNSGFLKFTKKNKSGRGAKKDTLITQDTLISYFKELKTLILEIMDPGIAFIEKDIKKH